MDKSDSKAPTSGGDKSRGMFDISIICLNYFVYKLIQHQKSGTKKTQARLRRARRRRLKRVRPSLKVVLK